MEDAVAHVRASDLSMLRRWVVARVRLTLRSSRAAFFTFVFPLLLLVLLNATSGDGRISVPGGKIDFAQYFTPSIAIYALTVACYATPILALATARELGLLKRVRGTPLSPWVYLGAWLVAAILTGLAAVVLMFVVAVPAFGVELYPRLLPAAIVTALLGASALAAIGLAVASFVPRAEAAPAVANLTLFPLSFLSGVFFPIHGAPDWVVRIAHIFPLSHIVEAFTACFNPHTQGSGFAPRDLVFIAAWGGVAMIVAARRFRWETEERGDSTRRRRPWLGNAFSGPRRPMTG
jgi:ABC-2 type transport system permease protein